MAAVASVMSTGLDVPSASTRIHWYVKSTPVSPSVSMMGLASAVSTCPACAVPEIAGSPVAALFAGRLSRSVRSMPGGQMEPTFH